MKTPPIEPRLAQASDDGRAQHGAVQLGVGKTYRWRVTEAHVDMAMAMPAPLRADLAAQPQNITVDLRRSAMIVVDMQNDFCAEGGWCDSLGADLAPERAPIGPLTRLLPVLRAAGVPIIWLNWGNRPDRANLEPPVLHIFQKTAAAPGIGEPVPGKGAPLLEKDSWGAAVVDGLTPLPGDIHVDKFRISGFWDTPLDTILRNLGVKTIFFGGVNTDQCVLHTLTDANFSGYGCVLLEDCCGTTSPAFCTESTLWNVKKIYGFVTQSDAVIAGVKAAHQT
jgi:nicotinamidase-related amidase